MRKSFETNLIGEMGESQNIEIVLDYEKQLERPNPEDFDDIYQEKEIKKDLEYLELAEKRIEDTKGKMNPREKEISETNEKRGKAFEILLADQIYDGDWMGPEAMTTRTSRYDDVIGGVDLIVEFDRGQTERIAFAVDASTASDVDFMEKKILKNIKKIVEGEKSPAIKYFESQIRSEDGSYYKGKLEKLIPVVVGADRHNADQLFEIFSELKNLEKNKKGESKERKQWLRNELAKHPIQGIFLKEIKIQLEMYQSILKDKNKEETFKECDRLLSIINEIITEKREAGLCQANEFSHDNTLDNIEIISKKYIRSEKGGF